MGIKNTEQEIFDCPVMDESVTITYYVNHIYPGKTIYYGYKCNFEHRCVIAVKKQDGSILRFEREKCPIETSFKERRK